MYNKWVELNKMPTLFARYLVGWSHNAHQIAGIPIGFSYSDLFSLQNNRMNIQVALKPAAIDIE